MHINNTCIIILFVNIAIIMLLWTPVPEEVKVPWTEEAVTRNTTHNTAHCTAHTHTTNNTQHATRNTQRTTCDTQIQQ